MRIRQAIAFLGLGGLLVSLYLLLYKIGAVGELVCAVEGCEAVQASPYATFRGLPVAGWGVLGYAAILGVAAGGAHPAWADRRAVTFGLIALPAIGFAFSTYLTYLELFVIHAICFWCLVSYLLITTILVLAVVAWVQGRPRSGEPAGAGADR